MEHYGCSLCHADTRSRWPVRPGPEIAAEVPGARHAPQTILADVVKEGQGTATRSWPMPPLPEVTDADAKRIVHYVLGQKRL